MTYRYFGIDIHKEFVMVAAVDKQQRLILKPQRVAITELPTWAAQTLTPQDRVVIEVTTNSWHVYDTLAEQAGQVVVANPHKTRLIAEARIKTDKVDAAALARLLASDFICEVWVPSQQVRQQRALVTHRATLSRQIGRVKNRIHTLLYRHNLRSPEKYIFSAARNCAGCWWQRPALLSGLTPTGNESINVFVAGGGTPLRSWLWHANFWSSSGICSMTRASTTICNHKYLCASCRSGPGVSVAITCPLLTRLSLCAIALSRWDFMT